MKVTMGKGCRKTEAGDLGTAMCAHLHFYLEAEEQS